MIASEAYGFRQRGQWVFGLSKLVCAALTAGLMFPGINSAVASDAEHPSLINSPAFKQHWAGQWRGVPSLLFNQAGALDASADPEMPTPPLKGAYLDKFNANADELRAIKAGKLPQGAGQFAGCPTPTMPFFMFGGDYPTEIVVSEAGIYLISEFLYGAVRRIYTDGRPPKQGDDLFPSFMGRSLGRWVGNTLYVDTVGIKAGRTDVQTEHSDAAHITEQIRLIDRNTLEDRITLEDPKAQTGPWKATRIFKRAPPGEEAIEFVCGPGDRNF